GVSFVDVGANIGYYSLLAASRVGEAGHVHAFEPSNRNCALLQASVDRNGFRCVDLYPFAVADRSTTLVYDAVASNGSVSEPEPGAPALDLDLVRSVRLDDVLAGLPVDVMKIDVE